MDPRQFAYLLMRDPDAARAVMALVEAEDAIEEDGKHFPFSAAGGSSDDEATATHISSVVEKMLAQPSGRRELSRGAGAAAAVVVALADGWELCSGLYDPDDLSMTCGEWVSLNEPDGREYLYWAADEWRCDPELVMGTILNAAAGYRVYEPPTPVASEEAEQQLHNRRRGEWALLSTALRRMLTGSDRLIAERTAARQAAAFLASALAPATPRFDSERFLADCGVEV